MKKKQEQKHTATKLFLKKLYLKQFEMLEIADAQTYVMQNNIQKFG